MLVLPIKRKYFEMIANREKKEEYREIKPYWTKRLLKTILTHEQYERNCYRLEE